MFSFLAGGRTDTMQRCFAWYDKAVLMASGIRENYFKVFEDSNRFVEYEMKIWLISNTCESNNSFS